MGELVNGSRWEQKGFVLVSETVVGDRKMPHVIDFATSMMLIEIAASQAKETLPQHLLVNLKITAATLTWDAE